MDSQTYYQRIMHDIVSQTDSSLIIFFILVIISMVIFILPFYVIILKDRKEQRVQDNIRHERYIKREREIIHVVTANTEAIAGLKSTMDITVTSNASTFTRIHDRIDEQNKLFADLIVMNTKTVSALDELIRKQQLLSNDMKRGFDEVRQILNSKND